MPTDSVHLHHIPTDPILVCNLHATVLVRTIIFRKIKFVCKILKIFPSTYKSHVMNWGGLGGDGQVPTSRSKSKPPPRRYKHNMHTCSWPRLGLLVAPDCPVPAPPWRLSPQRPARRGFQRQPPLEFNMPRITPRVQQTNPDPNGTL
jgi:hypothetical protein